MPTRRVLSLTGSDTQSFLQGLVTNDIAGLQDGLVYTALLTPQGKYLADFFLKRDADAVLVDVAEELADGLAKRLGMYKLRANLSINSTDLQVQRGTGPAPMGACPIRVIPTWGGGPTRPQPKATTDRTGMRSVYATAFRKPASS